MLKTDLSPIRAEGDEQRKSQGQLRKEKKERDRARKANAERVLPISRSGIVFNINYADKDCTYYQRKGFCMFNFLSQQKHGCNLCRFRHEKSDVKILSNAEIKAHMAEEARLNPQELILLCCAPVTVSGCRKLTINSNRRGDR